MHPFPIIPEDTLPDWVRLAQRGTDWGILIAILLGVAVGWSFIVYDTLPRTTAHESAIYQTDDVATAFLEGRIYPRWSPHSLQGLGMPVYHFLPPAPTYFTALLTTLLTNDSVQSIRWLYVLAYALASGATYALVLRHSTARTALVASLLYVYSPTVAYIIPHQQAQLADMVMVALLPSWLWAIDRLLDRHHPYDSLWLGGLTALGILTSPEQSLMALPLGLTLIACHWRDWSAWRTLLLSLLIGILLASFFLVPAWLEQVSVFWKPHPLSFLQPTLSLTGLLSPFEGIDSRALIPPVQMALGTVLLVTALLSAIVLWRLPHVAKSPIHGAFLITGASLIGLAGWVFSAPFYWLTPISLSLALGGSGLMATLDNTDFTQKRLLFVGMCVAIVTLTLPSTISPRAHVPAPHLSPLGQIRYEQQGFGVAVLPPNAAIPTSLYSAPFSTRNLLARYQTDTLSRLESDSTINDQVSVIAIQSHEQRYQVITRDMLRLRVLLSPFEGWTAWLDGRSIPLDETMMLTIPANTNAELRIRLESTPIRQLGWAMSGVALFSLIGLAVFNRRHAPRYRFPSLLTDSELRLLLFGLLVALIIALATQSNIRTTQNNGLKGATLLNYRTNSGLELMSFRLSHTEIKAKDKLIITLYWQASRPPSENYKVNFTLTSTEQGQVWATSAQQHIGNYPTKRWIQGYYVVDIHTIQLPETLPSGRYALTLEAFPCPNDTDCLFEMPLSFFDSRGGLLGTAPTLPRLLTVQN